MGFFEADDYFDKFEINNRVILDIGGNVGDTALKFAKGGTVYAFEPMPSLYEIALENINLNPSYKDKIYFYNKAISCKKGKMTIYEDDFNTGGHSQFETGGKQHIVDSITITDAIKEFDIHPDVLKMDCEGCEYSIILDSDLTMFKDIIFEYHQYIVKKTLLYFDRKIKKRRFQCQSL